MIFFAGLVFRKSTYPIGHRRFTKNLNPTKKARIWPQTQVLQLLLKAVPLDSSFTIFY